MKSHTVNIKQSNMLCHRCVMNVVRALSEVENIQKLDVSLETNKIKIVYNDKYLDREKIIEIVHEAITKGKIKNLSKKKN